MNFGQSSSQEPTSENQTVRLDVPEIKPIVTYTLLGLTITIYLIQTASRYFLNIDWPFVLGGKINHLIIAGQFWRLVTPAFLHSNIMHIGFNMYALTILGRRLERTYGHGRFLLLYLLAAFGGNVLSFVLSPTPSLGSSTGVFGLLAAEAVFIYQNRKLFGQRTRNMLSNILMILFINLAIGLSPNTNIDNFGHLGGLLAGFLFASLGGPKWVVEGISPFLLIKDSRPKREVWVAVAVVLVGFVVMAGIPFVS